MNIPELTNSLPSGSGIDGDWTFEQDGTTMCCANTYSAMLNGMYCHHWDFEVRYEFDNGEWVFIDLIIDGDTKSCECGNGLQEYLEGAMPF